MSRARPKLETRPNAQDHPVARVLHRGGYQQLQEVLEQLCGLGNAALQERRDAWKMARKRISYQDQCRSLTQVRHDDPAGLGRVNVSIARGALQRVERAYKAFFQRCREHRKPGYPRFRSRHRYATVETNHVRENHVHQGREHAVLRINGLPRIRMRIRQPLPDQRPRTIRITRRSRGCTVDLVYAHEPQKREETGETVGVDLGVRKHLTLSTGEKIAPEHEDWKTIRRAQRAVARCHRRSRTRRKRVGRLARLRRRSAVRRRNACHRITSRLIEWFDTIAVEDVAIGNMTRSGRGTTEAPGRNVRAKRGLNRSILEQAWGQILAQLDYKAAWAGRRVVRVDPRFTSQDCAACGRRREKPDAHEHWRCSGCGAEHDRDANAAINIHRAGILALGSLNDGRAVA